MKVSSPRVDVGGEYILQCNDSMVLERNFYDVLFAEDKGGVYTAVLYMLLSHCSLKSFLFHENYFYLKGYSQGSSFFLANFHSQDQKDQDQVFLFFILQIQCSKSLHVLKKILVKCFSILQDVVLLYCYFYHVQKLIPRKMF